MAMLYEIRKPECTRAMTVWLGDTKRISPWETHGVVTTRQALSFHSYDSDLVEAHRDSVFTWLIPITDDLRKAVEELSKLSKETETPKGPMEKLVDAIQLRLKRHNVRNGDYYMLTLAEQTDPELQKWRTWARQNNIVAVRGETIFGVRLKNTQAGTVLREANPNDDKAEINRVYLVPLRKFHLTYLFKGIKVFGKEVSVIEYPDPLALTHWEKVREEWKNFEALLTNDTPPHLFLGSPPPFMCQGADLAEAIDTVRRLLLLFC